MRTALSLVMTMFLLGCGGPVDGSPCNAPGTAQCSGSTSWLVCEGSTWRAYPCPSCAADQCNWKGAANGAACPEISTGDGWCPLDGRVLSCYWSSSADAGVFVEVACASCAKDKSVRELGKCTGSRCTCQ
jgi:hypothetical protein